MVSRFKLSCVQSWRSALRCYAGYWTGLLRRWRPVPSFRLAEPALTEFSEQRSTELGGFLGSKRINIIPVRCAIHGIDCGTNLAPTSQRRAPGSQSCKDP